MDKRSVSISTSISQDGLGIPVVSIYFSYCDKKDKTGMFCPNCHNIALQKDGVGELLSLSDIINKIDMKLRQMDKMFGDVGICFLGGEALCDKNRSLVIEISKHYKDRFQITYTWRSRDLINIKWLEYIDKIVCGEYIEGLKDNNYILGSTNQYIINGKKEVIHNYKKEGT